MTHETAILPLQILIAATTAGISLLGWRYRARPGGHPFVALTATFAILSVIPLAMPSHTHWLTSVFDSLYTLVPVLWILFVLNYTGYARFVNRYTVAAISAVPALTIIMSWIPPLFDLALETGIIWVSFAWMLGLFGAGIILLLKFVFSKNRLYTDQSVALIIGIAAPLVATISTLVNAYPFGVNPFLPSFGVLAIAFGFALFRSELFDVLPITQQIGRDAVIEDIQEGVVIADTSGQIVDANRAGKEILGHSHFSLVGQSLQDVFGEQASTDSESAGTAPAVYRTDGGRVYDVIGSQIRDRNDRSVGRAIVFRDITDRELREIQLEVLNRVLRHNLRNKLNIVQAHAEVVSARVDDEEADHVRQQLAAIDDLLALGDRAREFEALKTREEAAPRPIDVPAMIEDLIETLVAEFPDVAVTTDIPADLTMTTYPTVLEAVLTNLLRNGAEHANRSPRIDIVARMVDGEVEFAVRDNGPGIPEDELAVIEAETETPLEHGSGLGLWIATWGVRYLGGSLTFGENDPHGTTALVTLPHR